MSEQRKKYRIQASTTTNTHVYCMTAARRALRDAQGQEPGYFYSCMVASVFAAFTVEGFLNHLGQWRVRDWKAFERHLGPREKLLLLQQVLHLTVDHGARPFQSLRDMLRVRDALAHGKTITVTSDLVVENPRDEAARYPEPPWRNLCRLSSVERMVEDAEGMVRNLHAQTGSNRDPFDSPGGGSAGVFEVPDEDAQ